MDGLTVFTRLCQYAPHLTRIPEPTRVHMSNGILIRSAVFPQLIALSLYFTMEHPFPHSKLPIRTGRYAPHLIHDSLAHPSPDTKQHLNQFSSSAGLTIVTDRPTNRQTMLLGL